MSYRTLAFARSVTEFHEHHNYIQADNVYSCYGTCHDTMPTSWLDKTRFLDFGLTQKLSLELILTQQRIDMALNDSIAGTEVEGCQGQES